MVTILTRCCKTRINMNLITPSTTLICQKYISQQKPGLRRRIYKKEKVKKLQMNILQRYVDYVKNYDKVIEQKLPTAMHLYRTFMGGVKEFYRDLKIYITIIRRLQTTKGGLKNLNLNEIELYHKMPKDMIKIAPVLLLSTLPFTNYVILPLTYYFPRQLLCHHFWTLQQRSEFQTYYLKGRLGYQRPTFRCLQAELDDMKNKNHPLFKQWAHILGLIGSGRQPDPSEILECIELFNGAPYHFNYMKINHVKNLLKMHGMGTSIWFRRTRLKDRAHLIQAMDKAICRENGPEHLSHDSLRYACTIRGLNPVNMSHDQMVQWLKQWMIISTQVEPENASLLLHCPILLGYNQPSNWWLIYQCQCEPSFYKKIRNKLRKYGIMIKVKKTWSRKDNLFKIVYKRKRYYKRK